MVGVTQEEVEKHMLETPTVPNIRHWSKEYSSKPHLAGDLAHAEAIRDLWLSYGIETKLVQYDVLQNFPIEGSLKLHCSSKEEEIVFEASLTEDKLEADPTSDPSNGLPAFHGFSANGNVFSELVYANFGTLQDFTLLESKGVSVDGKIVICKYGKVFRGLKVRAAQQFGAIGVIIYNDPQEDGEKTIANGYKPYPEGPARHPSSIQRGSVDFFSVAVGDPTTPGYASLPADSTERQDPQHAIPKIPSLPISYADATPFLTALNGHGLSPEEIGGKDGEWKGCISGVEYCTGPSVSKVALSNQGDYRISPIYNVIGTIEGETEEMVILGNHHDSWCCGAIDPISGSSVMNEVTRGLGELCKSGWKPLRKIVLASWDNEEYGLVGSTEYGEDHAEEISKNCVAYLNVDESTNGGAILGVTGSPLLAKSLVDIMQIIPSPLEGGKTVYSDWLTLGTKDYGDHENAIGVIGTGSDYTVFFHHLGIPSVDLLFNRKGNAVYPYHSNYDSFLWIEKFGDPGFKKHLAMAQLWGLMAVQIANKPLLNFRAHSYALTLQSQIDVLEAQKVSRFNTELLSDAIERFTSATLALDQLAESYTSPKAVPNLDPKIATINKRYRDLEKSFLLEKGKGLPGRPWYRHLIFAPGLWAGYDGVVFPGILECLEAGDVEGANAWVGRIATALDRASILARGES